MAHIGACRGTFYCVLIDSLPDGRSIAVIRVLVADDFKAWRHFVSSTLQKQSELRIVDEASNGLEAIHKAKELQPDLVLLDIGLPKLNGIEAAIRIHQAVPAAKILFVSAVNDAEVVRAALSNGAQGYALKMDAGTELLPAIEDVIQGKRFVSSRLKTQLSDS
jgi:DNA-binding NarL/FixJ family response regulator